MLRKSQSVLGAFRDICEGVVEGKRAGPKRDNVSGRG